MNQILMPINWSNLTWTLTRFGGAYLPEALDPDFVGQLAIETRGYDYDRRQTAATGKVPLQYDEFVHDNKGDDRLAQALGQELQKSVRASGHSSQRFWTPNSLTSKSMCPSSDPTPMLVLTDVARSMPVSTKCSVRLDVGLSWVIRR